MTGPKRSSTTPGCHFCPQGIEHVDFKDVALLRRYVSDRGRIRSRRTSGNCARHQGKVARAIKSAREMGLLSYAGDR